MQEHTFVYNSENLKYYSVGSSENPPIIFIHGYTSSHHVWRQTIPVLKDKFYCIAIDLMGHGASDILPNGDYSIEAQGKRVLALADELGFEKFTLIGHSMGGQIAMCIASILAPERVIKLANVDGVAAGHLVPALEAELIQGLTLIKFFPFIETLFRWFNIDYKWGAYYQFRSRFYDFNAMPFDDWRIDRQMANLVGMRHAWHHALYAILDLDLTTHLSKILAPTLVIFGKNDAVVPVSDGYLADEHIPNSQLIIIDNCGHFPMYEATEAYLEAVREFLL